jgi:hypothetical protein
MTNRACLRNLMIFIYIYIYLYIFIYLYIYIFIYLKQNKRHDCKQNFHLGRSAIKSVIRHVNLEENRILEFYDNVVYEGLLISWKNRFLLATKAGFFIFFFLLYDYNTRRHDRVCKAQLTIETTNINGDGD